MRGSNKRRIRSEIIARVHSDEDEDVGTAARTRPLSYDEIMLKRKNRKILEYGNDGESEVVKVSRKESTQYDSGKSAHGDANMKPNDVRESYSWKEEKPSKRGSENAKSKNKDHQELKANFGQKMEKTMQLGKDVSHRNNDKMEKDVHHRGLEKIDEGTHHRSGEKAEKDVHHRSGAKLGKDVQHRLGESSEKNVHGRSGEKSEKARSGDKLEKHMHQRFSVKVEKVAYHQSNVKREKDTSYRASPRTERNTSRKSKQNSEKDLAYNKSLTVERDNERTNVYDRLKNNSEYENEKKHHRDHLTSDTRNIDRDATTEREYKRNWSGDDVQHSAKKYDSGKKLVPELSKRKDKIDSSISRHEEQRLKRRPSKSPEHRKDRGRRSGSFSPSVRKYSSSRVDVGNEALFNKDRSKHQSDVDRNKSSNGSGSGGLYHRHGGSSSGLGGYSPRKRKTDAAVRTPSPLKRSPEKKNAGLDHNLSGTTNAPSSAPFAPQLLVQAKPLILVESAGGTLANVNISNSLSNLSSSIKSASVDSVQLTQATRPLRRLYVDNVPSSASEKEIMECFNNFLLFSGANQIQGSKPCISCMIHKEKGQALVEFLTPEDASAALAFDGRSLFGSSLKIRRPKDFIEMANDFPEKSKPGADAVSDIVKDSPHKIFVGGISSTLTYEMLLEILRAFGPLKAFHFEINEKISEPCAFLEFVDQSVTLKACAALNGMKLGGKVLTVAQAFPDESFVGTHGDVSSYEIPQHVKTLLEKPTEVLKIKNAVNPLTIESLSEFDLEEILEDVRQECTRFGSVKSVNIAKAVDVPVPETHEATDLSASCQTSNETGIVEETLRTELDVGPYADSRTTLETGSPCNIDDEAENEWQLKERLEDALSADPTTGMEETVTEELRKPDSATEPIRNEDNKVTTEVPAAEFHENKEMSTSVSGDGCKTSGDKKEKGAVSDNVSGSEANSEQAGEMDEKVNADHVFEPGCIFVEFRRIEAACLAAHCLHGRLFDGRTVTVEYVPHNLYKRRFAK